jgi:ribosome-binding factor A
VPSGYKKHLGRQIGMFLPILNFWLYLCPLMASIRLEKIERLLQKELSQVFQQLSRNLFGGALITVTQVRISPDLGVAKVYLSLYLTADKKKLIDTVTEHKNEIRKELGLRVGKQMRVTPYMTFFLDDSLDYLENIERLLK